jgi:uncharacterized membrane protein
MTTSPTKARTAYLSAPSLTGLATATLLICLGFTPSLLPRIWPLQAVVNVVLGSLGYALGRSLVWMLGRSKRDTTIPDSARKVVYICAALAYFVFLALGYMWHKQGRLLIGLPPESPYSAVGITVLTFLGLAIALLASRLTLQYLRWLVAKLNLFCPRWLSQSLAILFTLYIVVGSLDGFLKRWFVSSASQVAKQLNDLTEVGVEQPQSELLSGGHGSLIDWETIGRKGRTFISDTVTLEALFEFHQEKPSEPVRVYAGVESAPTPRERAELAVEELKRVGGFERQVILVTLPTGTGWINTLAVDPIEYMFNGNSAIVATQYSYLSSILSFLLDEDLAREAGVELFNAVYDEWLELPVESRPLLLSYGESLGSFGTEAAFPTTASFRATSQGALLIGPPNENAVWSKVVAHREKGTPMILPIVGNGETVRFASRPQDLKRPDAPWLEPRAVYLQNPSDPIVWWSMDLLYRQPDWLKEKPGGDINPAIRWIPIVTFVQVTGDLMVARAPAGHGHRYGTLPVDAWAKIASPPGWDGEKTTRLKKLLEPQAD